jgi:hypothetical protein
MTVISNSIDASEWTVFRHQTQDGRPITIRSRVGETSVRRFAESNCLIRARCALPRDQVDDDGMPRSTASLDEWEAKLLTGIERMDERAYAIAVVTGAGVRDLFLATVEEHALLTAISDIEGDFTFELQLARVDATREELLNSLTPPQ